MSPAPESEAVLEEKARNIVRLRANGVCEAAIPNVCWGSHDTVHHRKKRRYADVRWVASNLLAVCGNGTMGCHGYIEAHPTWAEEEGYWLRAHDDPREVSVHMRHHSQRSWWLLDDDGMLEWDGADFEDLKLVDRWATKFGPKPHR